MREAATEVLVVGAGPVGLWTALLLARAGIQVSVIDQEARTAARSYACALHPRTLKMLQGAGLAESLVAQGRRLPTLAFYDPQQRRAEINLSALGGEFPFLLTLPQNALESALEAGLRQAGVRVNWNHRFDSLETEAEEVLATVEELSGTATGYIVPHWETVVKGRSAVRARFLIGADGHNSLVRQRLAIEYQRFGMPQFFAAYEFESQEAGPDELRVVLDENTTNVLWPLAQQRFRWTFQVMRTEMAPEFPEKERRAVQFQRKEVDERVRAYVQKVAGKRAPWFKSPVQEILWCTEVAFEQRVAQQLGRGHCWLAGDAAHQTGPVGVQSMNAGFGEGAILAERLRRVLRSQAPLEELETYGREQHQQWQRLLGASGGLKPRTGADPWVRDQRARILPCLPGTAEDLDAAAEQLKLELR